MVHERFTGAISIRNPCCQELSGRLNDIICYHGLSQHFDGLGDICQHFEVGRGFKTFDVVRTIPRPFCVFETRNFKHIILDLTLTELIELTRAG